MMAVRPPSAVSGYVLAGGKSSRMGRDKALLELAGKPLLAHAVSKLRRVCSEVSILSANPAHGGFAPLVHDLHPGCGPLAGIEAALAHSNHEWCVLLPVDMPFLPTIMLDAWIRACMTHGERDGTRLAMFVLDGKPQPALLMIHRDLAGYVSTALGREEYKLLPGLMGAAEDLAAKRGLASERVSLRWAWGTESRFSAGQGEPAGEAWRKSTHSQEEASRLYFANLNTPEDFAEAERHMDVLDT